MMDWLAIQTRLKELGFDPGPLDNEYGPRTRSAVRRFQEANKVAVKWPGTIDIGNSNSKTLKALFPEDGAPEPSPAVRMPWMHIAAKKMGLHETYNYTTLSSWLKGGWGYLGDPRKLPWCGDFVETCIAQGLPDEPRISNPYLARNWLKFGKDVKPTRGAIGVFWRGSKSGISGHVGFLVGQSTDNYHVLGGNQSNAINVKPLGKYRLLGARWPKTHESYPTYLPRMSGGSVSVNEF